jgi:hypothetical protein
LLTTTQWVEVRGDFCWYWWNNNSTNITKNHLSPHLIEWWSTIPPISTKIISHLNSLSDGQQFHQYQQKSPLPSLNELRWEVVFADIGGIVNHHSMSWGERWCLLILVELLTTTQWVEVKNHLSPQLIEWWSTIPPISTKITSHLNSLSGGQQFHQYQQTPPLTSTHWVMVNNSTNISKHDEVRGDFWWYWWNCLSSLNELRGEVIFVDIGGIVDHHSMS